MHADIIMKGKGLYMLLSQGLTTKQDSQVALYYRPERWQLQLAEDENCKKRS